MLLLVLLCEILFLIFTQNIILQKGNPTILFSEVKKGEKKKREDCI